MSIFHIWPEEPHLRNGNQVLSATLEMPTIGKERLWYSVPENQKNNLCENADPFVVGAIYRIMECGFDVKVHGTLSPSLIRNLEEYQAAWSEWLPSLKRVRIHADREEETVLLHDRTDAIIPFSAGVDSCFSAYRHARSFGPQVPHKITSAIMVQGFDIPLDDSVGFHLSVEKSGALLNSLNIELIPISTNFRELVTDWSHSFGSALVSCLSLFSGRFSVGLVGQGLTYSECSLLHEGSNPLTDALLSSDSFRIVPDGTGFTRADKIYAMRDWDEFLHHLRVCWQGEQRDRNCCACEKCIRNILTFRALGLGLPPCFPIDVDDATLEMIGLGGEALSEIRYAGLRDLAEKAGTQGKWNDILDARLDRIRRKRERKRNTQGMSYVISRIRHKMAVRTRLKKLIGT